MWKLADDAVVVSAETVSVWNSFQFAERERQRLGERVNAAEPAVCANVIWPLALIG